MRCVPSLVLLGVVIVGARASASARGDGRHRRAIDHSLGQANTVIVAQRSRRRGRLVADFEVISWAGRKPPRSVLTVDLGRACKFLVDDVFDGLQPLSVLCLQENGRGGPRLATNRCSLIYEQEDVDYVRNRGLRSVRRERFLLWKPDPLPDDSRVVVGGGGNRGGGPKSARGGRREPVEPPEQTRRGSGETDEDPPVKTRDVVVMVPPLPPPRRGPGLLIIVSTGEEFVKRSEWFDVVYYWVLAYLEKNDLDCLASVFLGPDGKLAPVITAMRTGARDPQLDRARDYTILNGLEVGKKRQQLPQMVAAIPKAVEASGLERPDVLLVAAEEFSAPRDGFRRGIEALVDKGKIRTLRIAIVYKSDKLLDGAFRDWAKKVSAIGEDVHAECVLSPIRNRCEVKDPGGLELKLKGLMEAIMVGRGQEW